MPEKWTGHLVGRMHNENITNEDLGKELGVTSAYVSMVLNSKRTPADGKERFTAAVDSIIQKRSIKGGTP